MNEPRTIESEDEWRGGTKDEREVINRLNSAFVETVRSTEGKNGGRWLIITTYGSNDEKEALESFKIPKEDNKLIVAVHAYTPYSFAQDNHGVSEWSVDNKEDTESILELMGRLDKCFIQKNIPVLLTEFGSIDKDNLDDRVAWAQYYTEEAKKNKVGYIWWDNGDEYSLMDRENYSWKFPEIVEVLTR